MMLKINFRIKNISFKTIRRRLSCFVRYGIPFIEAKLYRYQSTCKHVHSIGALIHQIKFCQKNECSTFLINFSCNFKRFTSRKVLISRHDSENYRIWIRDKREKHFTDLNLKWTNNIF
uniref:Candidate secreted effector n=1 Tax=Meloidogyne incognita TaxID=6306 RepID=A0A914LGL5_MELIC